MLQKSNIETCYLERTCLRDSRGSPFGHAYPAAASRPFGVSAPCRPGSARKASANLAREGRFDYLLVEATGISQLLPSAEPRLGRRTVLTILRAASRDSPGPLPFEDQLASNRSRHLPRC